MSIQKRFSGFSDNKNRKDEYDGYHGECHAGDGSDGEVEPEDFLGAVGQERQKAEDCGQYGETDRGYLT